MSGPFIPTPRGVRIVLHVQPRARTTAVTGRSGEALRIRVQAPPVDGAANAAVIRFLSDVLGVPRHRIHLTGGAGARRKTVEVDGLSPAEAEALLAP